MVPVGDNEFEH